MELVKALKLLAASGRGEYPHSGRSLAEPDSESLEILEGLRIWVGVDAMAIRFRGTNPEGLDLRCLDDLSLTFIKGTSRSLMSDSTEFKAFSAWADDFDPTGPNGDCSRALPIPRWGESVHSCCPVPGRGGVQVLITGILGGSAPDGAGGEFSGHAAEAVQERLNSLAGFVSEISGTAMELAFARSEGARFKRYVEHSNDTIWESDMALNWRYISPSVRNLRGFTPEEAKSQTLDTMMAPESVPLVMGYLQSGLADLAQNPTMDMLPILFEAEQNCADGSTVWTEVTVSVLKDENKLPCGILGATRNISDRKRADAELRYRLDYEKILVDLSLEFINASTGEFDRKVSGALERIAEFAGFDTAGLFLVSHDTKTANLSYFWFREGIDFDQSVWRDVPLSEYRWLIDELTANDYVHVTDTMMMDGESSAVGDIVRTRGITSFTALPVKVGGLLRGLVVFSMRSGTVSFEGEFRSLGFLVSELFSNWMEKVGRERELEKYSENLEEMVAKRTEELLDASRRLGAETLVRTKTEKALAESEARFRAIVESASDSIVVWNSNLYPVYSNPSAQRIDSERSVNLTTRVMMGNRDSLSEPFSTFKGGIDDAIAGSRTTDFEVPFRSGHEEVILEGAFFPIRDEQGDILSVGAVYRDVTVRKKLENEIYHSRRMESLGLLAGGIAHDFNNIMTSVTGCISLAGLLLSRTQMDDPSIVRAIEKLRTAERDAMKTRELANQILTFSKGGAPILEERNVSGMIRDAVKFVLRGTAVRTNLSIEENLWPVAIDQSQIYQVLHNILMNSADAMNGFGVVSVGARNIDRPPDSLPIQNEEGLIQIRIADNGPGIPQSIRDRVFDPFFTTRPGKSGLGLATAMSIIRRHGGTIVIEDGNPGAVLTVYLKAHPMNPVSSFRNRNDTRGYSPRGTVMLVGGKTCGTSLSNILEGMRFSVDSFDNIDQGVAAFSHAVSVGDPPSVVIVDIDDAQSFGEDRPLEQNAKDIARSGSDIASRFNGVFKGVKLFAAVDSSSPLSRESAFEIGFCGLLSRPYRVSEITGEMSGCGM